MRLCPTKSAPILRCGVIIKSRKWLKTTELISHSAKAKPTTQQRQWVQTKKECRPSIRMLPLIRIIKVVSYMRWTLLSATAVVTCMRRNMLDSCRQAFFFFDNSPKRMKFFLHVIDEIAPDSKRKKTEEPVSNKMGRTLHSLRNDSRAIQMSSQNLPGNRLWGRKNAVGWSKQNFGGWAVGYVYQLWVHGHFLHNQRRRGAYVTTLLSASRPSRGGIRRIQESGRSHICVGPMKGYMQYKCRCMVRRRFHCNQWIRERDWGRTQKTACMRPTEPQV